MLEISFRKRTQLLTKFSGGVLLPTLYSQEVNSWLPSNHTVIEAPCDVSVQGILNKIINIMI